MVDYSKIKLVIWDLDETFWKGTLSDNNVQIVNENVELIKNMIDAGVMCSICSKNDEQEVKNLMEKLGIWDLFVFRSINWTPKGERVKQVVEEMNLRQQNVLFIDDNNTNLGEVRDACPEMMVERIEIIPKLIQYFIDVDKKDQSHTRLEQYKVLEKKRDFKAKLGSNTEFLIKSNIKVTIKTDCLQKIDRIHDLILRSNQLNFTKIRSSKNELEEIIKDSSLNSGYIEVRDAFGDYGIVGFYAMKDDKLIHFVFSCRTLNMGIEQYIYHKLGKPQIEVVGEVSSNLNTEYPFWINNDKNNSELCKANIKRRLLIKGPCDMSQMFAFINDDNNIITEFVYVNDDGISIEQGNHTCHIIQSLSIDSQTKDRLVKSLPFGDNEMYSTRMFDDDISIVVYSLFTDPNLGLYQEKQSGATVAFGEHVNDLTDEDNWEKLINKEVFVANCNFTKENLKYIKENFEFKGRLTPNEVFNNLKLIRENLNKDTQFILILGSEIEYNENTQKAYKDRHKYNQELNKLVREWSKHNDNVKLIDVNEFIIGQETFTNNINHFNKEVYYKMSQKLIEIVNGGSQLKIKHRTKFNNIKVKIKQFFKKIKNRIKKLRR